MGEAQLKSWFDNCLAWFVMTCDRDLVPALVITQVIYTVVQSIELELASPQLTVFR
jgi:hypothetical protein